jgi:DNA-damage-inducible protein J
MTAKAKTDFIRARIEPDLKQMAEIILEKLGLNQTEAIRMFYKQIVLNKGLPFKVELPNKETLKAMQEAENNIDMTKCENADDMFGKLGI